MSARDTAYAALAATRPRVAVAGDAVEHFMARLRAQGGQCVRVKDDAGAREQIAALVREDDVQLLATGDPWIDEVLGLPGEALPPRTQATRGAIRGIAIGTALAAVAETGSLLLCPGRSTPMALHFLCDRLVILLRTADVLRNSEDLWARVREHFGDTPPRALCLVSGPSSSGDIGMQFATGVHGPIELHAIVVDGESQAGKDV